MRTATPEVAPWLLARQPHLLARALDHKPAVVMLSFGDARPFAAAIKDAGAGLISQVQTVAQAVEALDIGADIIVAQGTEAGGHGAMRSTLALVPAVVDAVRERNDEVVVVAARPKLGRRTTACNCSPLTAR